VSVALRTVQAAEAATGIPFKAAPKARASPAFFKKNLKKCLVRKFKEASWLKRRQKDLFLDLHHTQRWILR
jgi:hypothetical protein